MVPRLSFASGTEHLADFDLSKAGPDRALGTQDGLCSPSCLLGWWEFGYGQRGGSPLAL